MWNRPQLHGRAHATRDTAASSPGMQKMNIHTGHAVKMEQLLFCRRGGWVGSIGITTLDLVNKEDWRKGDLSAK